MDERARKYFNKAESELSEYERMMLGIMAANEPAEEAPAPVEEAPAEKAPVEEAPAEEAPAEEATEEEAPVEEAPEEEAPVEEEPTVVLPAGEPAAEEEPAEETPAGEEPEEATVKEEFEEATVVEPPAEDTDDSDMKIAAPGRTEEPRQPIPLLTEEKNPELEPVVINRPTIQFMNSIEREKKITRKVKRHRLRSGVVVMGLCVALILVAFLYKGLVLKEPILEKAEPTPEPTAEAVPAEIAATPEPTPVPTPEPTPEHRYVIEKANISWVGAQDRCLANGGYLAVINTRDEFNKITAQADEQGVEFLWIGARRDVLSNTFVWERDEKVEANVDPNDRRMSLWATAEPSFIDDVGTEENYLILWNHDGGWRYWDSIGDLSQIYGWRGRIAYVCEFDS